MHMRTLKRIYNHLSSITQFYPRLDSRARLIILLIMLKSFIAMHMMIVAKNIDIT